MIVVDSSVWIARLRNEPTPAVKKLDEVFRPRDIVVGDLVMLEVLQGARDERHAVHLERLLRAFRIEGMVDEAISLSAARYSRVLRDRGVAVRKTIDLLIASFCIERQYALLHQDRDFDMMAQHLPLRLA